MNFSEWLAANGYDAEALNDKQRVHLEAAWKAETQPPSATPAKDDEPSSFAEKMAAIEEEVARKAYIEAATVAACEKRTNDPEKVKQLRELGIAAIADPKMDPKAFDLALLRTDRMVGPMILTPRRPVISEDVLEAAVCQADKLENIESHYSPQTLEIAHKEFPRGLSLHGLIHHSARRNGWDGHDIKSNWKEAISHGFRQTGDYWAAEAGPSMYSLPNILSNVANKFLRVGFDAVDSAWREIAFISSFRDFKQKTTIALTGGMEYKELAPSGEIKHADIGERVWTNQARTYAIMLGLDRQTIINDDLGALTGAGRRMGRGAALKLNDRFWSVFLNNSTVFSVGNANVRTGGTSALSLSGLQLLDETFRLQTDPDGKPLGIFAAKLLVPPALRITAMNLMNSTFIVTGANTTLPSNNSFVGNYMVVSSPYMQNATYTGNSATAWYLIANPNDLPLIEVGFLDGMESPTVETGQAEFNHLGIALRGWYDFGVAFQEYRAGARAAGA